MTDTWAYDSNSKKANAEEMFITALEQGVDAAFMQNPVWFMKYGQKLENTVDRANGLKKKLERNNNMLSFEPFKLDTLLQDDPLLTPGIDDKLALWMNNIYEQKRHGWKHLNGNKQCHLWIVGTPSSGKSRFAQTIGKFFKTYTIHCGEQNFFQDDVTNDEWEILLLDEFSGKVKISTLNQICDGQYQYEVKYKKPIVLDKRPVIVITNSPPEIVFQDDINRNRDPEIIKALKTRFNFLDISGTIGNKQINLLHQFWDYIPNNCSDEMRTAILEKDKANAFVPFESFEGTINYENYPFANAIKNILLSQ